MITVHKTTITKKTVPKCSEFKTIKQEFADMKGHFNSEIKKPRMEVNKETVKL